MSAGISNARSPAKLSELTSPSATSSASASSICGRSSLVPSASSSKNEAPASRMKSATARARGLACAGSGVGDSAVQSGACRRASKVIGVVRTGPADPPWPNRRSPSGSPTDARPQPGPGDASGEALVVEPDRIVPGDARRQDLGLPGAGRRLEPFELAEHRGERVRPFHAGLVGHPLPGEQEAQEVARRDRLDLGAQPLQRIAVDARQQPALAPLVASAHQA